MKKTTLNTDRPPISSQEIKKGKNFNHLYNSYRKARSPFYKQKWFIANSIVVAGAIALIFFMKDEIPSTLEENPTTYTQFVNPPIIGVNVPFNSYTVNSNKPKTIRHQTGTLIKIPKDAFIDELGNLIKGKVEIKYREFKDVAEIIVSGIPMTFMQNDEEMHFESAGMIEILAYQDEKLVFMNPEKKIDIEMTSAYASTHYNLYTLDTTSKKWIDVGKDSVFVSNNESTPLLTEGILPAEILVAEKEIKAIQKTKPLKPIEATNERFRFDFDFKKDEFPELTMYNNMEFEVGNENKNFTPTLFESEWSNMIFSNEGNKYVMKLIRPNKKVTLVVYPVFVGDNYTKAKKSFDKKFKDYSKQLKKKQEEHKQRLLAYKKELADIEIAKKKREEERIKRNMEALKTQGFKEDIVRCFSVYQFGTMNCDSPIPQPKGAFLLANFVNKREELIQLKVLYLVEKSRNAVFPCSREFSYNPSAENFLIGITSDNKLVSYSREDFKKLKPNQKNINLKLNVAEKEISSAQDLKNCIRFL
jgi:hypothetical protein